MVFTCCRSGCCCRSCYSDSDTIHRYSSHDRPCNLAFRDSSWDLRDHTWVLSHSNRLCLIFPIKHWYRIFIILWRSWIGGHPKWRLRLDRGTLLGFSRLCCSGLDSLNSILCYNIIWRRCFVISHFWTQILLLYNYNPTYYDIPCNIMVASTFDHALAACINDGWLFLNNGFGNRPYQNRSQWRWNHYLTWINANIIWWICRVMLYRSI